MKNTVIWNKLALVSLVNTTGRFTFVDEKDWPKVSTKNVKLELKKNGRIARVYVCHHGKNISLSRFLTGKKYVEHIDRNPLNNSRSNYRDASAAENRWNSNIPMMNKTSDFLGCFYHKSHQRWEYEINCNGKRYTGWANSEIECAKARDILAIKLHGEFAVLNFPQKPQQALTQ